MMRIIAPWLANAGEMSVRTPSLMGVPVAGLAAGFDSAAAAGLAAGLAAAAVVGAAPAAAGADVGFAAGAAVGAAAGAPLQAVVNTRPMANAGRSTRIRCPVPLR